jgi:hypothetical protein
VSYAFPEHLTSQVVDRWRTFVSRHASPAPPLPGPRALRHLLETAFFASLEREEGRDLRFTLVCSPTLEIVRDGADDAVPVVKLESPRPLTVEALRSIAPAINPANAAILVRCPADADDPAACEIAGVLGVGSHLSRARRGRSYYHRPAPYALLIDVRDAGELHIYRGGIKLAALQAGQLHDQLASSELEFLPISSILSAGVARLRPRVQRPGHEPERETSDFEWTALLNTILTIVNGVHEHGHGGTMLLVAPGAETTVPVRMKFDVGRSGTILADRFVAFLNARHELVEARWRQKQASRLRGEAASASPAEAMPEAGGAVDQAALWHLQNATLVAEEDLGDAADLTARLSGVDGALVLGSDLRIVGFGAEILVNASVPVSAFEVSGSPHRSTDWRQVDGERFGMRHRSALRGVTVADDTAAFVVSQDGAVSFFWKQDNRVLLKRHVNTGNPSVVGA